MLFAGIRLTRNRSANAPAKGQLIGNLAPEFELPALDGKNLKLSDLRGKAVLSISGPPIAAPAKSRCPGLSNCKEYGPQGFQIVGVAMDDASTEDIAKFARK